MKHIVFNVYGTHVAHVCMQKKTLAAMTMGNCHPIARSLESLLCNKAV